MKQLYLSVDEQYEMNELDEILGNLLHKNIKFNRVQSSMNEHVFEDPIKWPLKRFNQLREKRERLLLERHKRKSREVERELIKAGMMTKEEAQKVLGDIC